MTFKYSFYLLFAVLFFTGCASNTPQQAITDPEEKKVLEALSASPNNIDAIGKAGDFYRKRFIANEQVSDAEKAIGYYEQFLQARPNHLNATVLLYSVHYRLHYDNHTSDLAGLEKLYVAIPEDSRVFINPPEAAEIYRLLLVDKDVSDATFQRIKTLALTGVKRAPKASRSYHVLYNVYIEDKRYRSAIALLKQALKHLPKNTEFLEYIADAYYDKAYENSCEFEDQKSWQGAAEYYTQAKKAMPENTTVRLNLTDAYFALDKRRLALHESKQIHKRDPSKESFINLLDAYIANKKYDSAYQLLEDSKTTYGKSLKTIDYAGDYTRIGRWEEALEAYKRHIFSYKRNNNLYHFMQASIVAEINGSSWKPKTNISKSGHTGWQKALLKYWQGDINENALLNTAKDRCEAVEANTYIGFRYFQKKEYAKAKEYLSTATQSGVPLFVEDAIATQLLNMIP